MEQKILNYLGEHTEGARQREIAASLRIWLCDSNFLDALYKLERENKIYATIYSDAANMEFYKVWHISD